MSAEIDRSVSGTVKVTGEVAYSRNYSGALYSKLTLDDIERFCIEARMYGAKQNTPVSVYSSSSGHDWLSIEVPATFEAIPEIPNSGHNARLNRKLAVVAAGAVTACVIMGLAFLFVALFVVR